MKRLLAGMLACIAATAAAQVPTKSDWEVENEERLKRTEEQIVPPPPLERSRLVEVIMEPRSSFRFFVDAGSISVGPGGIVRYVLVARSPSGVENVRFEGLRCPGEYRVYAVGNADGSWGGRAGAWLPIRAGMQLPEHTLSRQYFCPGREAIADAAEGAEALRKGGHPWLVRGEALDLGR